MTQETVDRIKRFYNFEVRGQEDGSITVAYQEVAFFKDANGVDVAPPRIIDIPIKNAADKAQAALKTTVAATARADAMQQQNQQLIDEKSILENEKADLTNQLIVANAEIERLNQLLPT